MTEKIDNFKNNLDIYSNMSESYEEEKDNNKQGSIKSAKYSYKLQNSKNVQNINPGNKNSYNSKSLNDIKMSKIIAEKVLKMINNSSNNNNKKFINKTENIKKIEKGHLNIYEREKRNFQRKAQLLKKKKQIEEQNQLSKLKSNPTIDEISKNILQQNGDYIPIQERARHLHHMHQSYCIIYKKKKQYLLKNKENQKNFNEKDWNNFIKSQEIWNKKKLLKKKALELLRESDELKISYLPKIDSNSKRIILNMRKGTSPEDNIYNKLYNDFTDLQERKQLKICNSMPSFKPFVNKGIKSNVFNNKNRKNQNKAFNRPNSALSFNFKLDDKKYKNMNYKNKKRGNKTSISSYNNNKSMNSQKTNNIENNIRNHSIGSYVYKKFLNKNHIKKS